MSTTVVAVGGNALQPPTGASRERTAHLLGQAVRAIAAHAQRGPVVVTHGNGPQVGALLEAQPGTPLAQATAQTQGSLGSHLTAGLRGEGLKAVCLVTHVCVASSPPAQATKPIGPIRAGRDAFGAGVQVVPAGGGWRRAVPSPQPTRVVELQAVDLLLRQGYVVVAAGGGGIPCLCRADMTSPVDGVIDKDLTASLLARGLQADLLVILTDVAGVFLDHGTPNARKLDRLDVGEARGHLAAGQFPPGSMGPKVQAVIDFLHERPAAQAMIAALDEPTQGTWITS